MPVICRVSNLILVGSLLLAPGVALSQDATIKPHVPLEKTIGQTTPTGPVPSLAVLNAAGAKLEGGKLTLTGVAPNSIVFADRPVRAAGHVMTEQFIMQWDEGKDSFAKDPPNATVSVLGGDGSKVSDAVVTLKTPKLEGGNLTFDVVVLEGSLAGSSGPAALFIDHFAAFGGGFHAGGFRAGGFHAGGFDAARFGGYRGGAWAGGRYWHAPVYHGAWYGAGATAAGVAAGTAMGAAEAANPDLGYGDGGLCGYYPYGPCY
ncbi:hypothetical protein [Microvirga tunisiensis]|jgi:hypothetical protein|uniref:Uncharacterized protein n=1 Tax=Microvirga tunisiensis TaxID=2108360 RepID=A0A5N7MUE2_9HYPH|nr:hypothetical protein [Microvirga tunisiensis]MPR12504.1 hypothetical protein [Microvirga tunisiensis]MPR30603.1 hypothetical protein [Microvirga tunisiensis]